MEEIKRIRYFDGEVLDETDFKAEQDYNRTMRHNHNRYFHTWGIGSGLEVAVSLAGNTKVTISPGIAFDGQGREILLASAVDFDFSAETFQPGTYYFLTIRWEQEEAQPRQDTPPLELKRWRETPLIEAAGALPHPPEMSPVLARVLLDANKSVTPAAIDMSMRKYSGAAVRSDSVEDYHLRDNAVTTPKIKEKAVTRAKINDGSVNEDKLSTSVTGKLVTGGDNHTHTAGEVGAMFAQEVKDYVDDLFCGSISAFAMTQVPPGWLECNGQPVSRSQFSRLFAKIGTTFGAGDGSTTFNVPDLRGEFIRGWDHGRGVDPYPGNRELGYFEGHQVMEHTHHDPGHYHPRRPDGRPERVLNDDSNAGNGHGEGTSNSNPAPGTTGTSGSGIRGVVGMDGGDLGNHVGSETRPRNIALMYCIKF